MKERKIYTSEEIIEEAKKAAEIFFENQRNNQRRRVTNILEFLNEDQYHNIWLSAFREAIIQIQQKQEEDNNKEKE
jgi:hypothetical protein